jgi:hypothetical protein
MFRRDKKVKRKFICDIDVQLLGIKAYDILDWTGNLP